MTPAIQTELHLLANHLKATDPEAATTLFEIIERLADRALVIDLRLDQIEASADVCRRALHRIGHP